MIGFLEDVIQALHLKKIKANSMDISSMDPERYSKRFINNLKVICRTENLFDGGKWEVIDNRIES